MTPAPLEEALTYAARGWLVLPIAWPVGPGRCCCSPNCDSPGKHPLLRHGVHDATTDRNLITIWWRKWPRANVGIAAGATSGMLVLDVDPPAGGLDSIATKVQLHGPLPCTVTAATGGHPDGRHYYFAHPGGRVPNKVALARGLDIRSDGGYVVAPPSRHASGRYYAWLDDGHPFAVPLAQAPAWLWDEIHGQQRDRVAFHRAISGRRRTFDADRVPPIGQGERNVRLASIAGRLLYEHRDRADAESTLLHVNASRCNPPLSEREVRKIAGSIYGKYSAS